MFNIGGAELLVILLVGLLVLGPDKLPEASKKIGSIMGDLRQMSNGFKSEMRQAMDVSTEAGSRTKGSELTQAPGESRSADSPAADSPAAGSPAAGSSNSGGPTPDTTPRDASGTDTGTTGE